MSGSSKIPSFARSIFNTLFLTEQVLGSALFSRVFGPYKKRFLYRLEKRTASTAEVEILPVDRVEDLDPGTFKKNYFKWSKPVIFSQAAQKWPCCEKWDFTYLAERYGQKEVLLATVPGLTSRQNRFDYEYISVRDLVGNIKQGGDKYLRFSPLLHKIPELTNDLDLDWLARMRGGGTFANTYYMFIGGAGKKTLLHADQPCNLYVQVSGEKKWTLIPAADSACLYPELTNTAYVKSPIDVDNADTVKYPLFKHARKYEAHLKAGDVLYVPPHVWHHVENLTDTIAVGYRFSSLKAATRSSLTLSMIRLLSNSPPFWKTRVYGKSDTNLIWMHAGGKIEQALEEGKRRGYEAP